MNELWSTTRDLGNVSVHPVTHVLLGEKCYIVITSLVITITSLYNCNNSFFNLLGVRSCQNITNLFSITYLSQMYTFIVISWATLLSWIISSFHKLLRFLDRSCRANFVLRQGVLSLNAFTVVQR